MIGERLNFLYSEMCKKGLLSTKRDFCELLKIEYGNFSKIVSGKIGFAIDSEKYEVLLKNNISVEWLLTGEGEMFKQNTEENLPDPVTYQVRIPVMSHNIVCDGANWENERNIEEYIDINNLSPSLKGRRIIGFRAKGTSMIGAGINNNDIVLFTPETDSKPEDGLYVFSLDGDAYCKRLEFDPIAKRIKIYSVRVADLEKAELLTTLCSTDPGYEERFYLFGKVFSCIHSFM